MQTIIRHVIRASKDKLTRGAGQFGLFGCDFLLDENYRIWLLEVNDNPGVGWGNSLLNTTTKPLFEETLNIVFECFEKYKTNQSLLPIQCLKNYQLIYNEDDDIDRRLLDDNQIFTERLSIRYAIKEGLTRKTLRRILPQINVSRTSSYQSDTNTNNTNDVILPLVNIENSTSSIIRATSANAALLNDTSLSSSIVNATNYTSELFEHNENMELENLIRLNKSAKYSKMKSSLSKTINGSMIKINKTSIKRTLSKTNAFDIERKKPRDLLPTIVDKRRCENPTDVIIACTDTSRREKKISKNKMELSVNQL